MRLHRVWPCFLFIIPLGFVAGAENLSSQRHFDWPQWLGPQRDGISREKGLLQSWPTEGPRLIWKASGLGGGYSTPSLARGRIFGMGFRGKDEIAWALNESTGKEIWNHKIADAKKASASEAPEGSRGSATVDGDWIYTLGQNGDLFCLAASDGKERWHKNLVKDFGGKVPRWGYSESPLIDGEKLICTPGGKKATLVALDKKTGDTLWESQVPEGDEAAYSSVIAGKILGDKEYVQLLARGLVGVAAETGKFLWRYDKPANRVANCSSPIIKGDSVFAASGYGTGGGLVHVVGEGSAIKAEETYFSKHMKNQHGGMVVVDGYLYGSDDPGTLTCLDFKTGKLMWSERKAGKGSITYADHCLYYRSEKGPMILVEANPHKYVELGRFDQPDPSGKATWPHPVIANGKLYLRDQELLFCYDVKGYK